MLPHDPQEIRYAPARSAARYLGLTGRCEVGAGALPRLDAAQDVASIRDGFGEDPCRHQARLDIRTMRPILILLLLIAACHVTPLPVANRPAWQPDAGATDYPSQERPE